MINSVNLTGRLTKNPELTKVNDIAKVSFSLAVNQSFKNQKGERGVDFINCVAWRRTAETMANHLQKGSLIGVEGRISTRNFEGKDGNRVFMTEIIVESLHFLEPKSSNQNSGNSQASSQQYPDYQQPEQQPQYQQQPNYQQPQQNRYQQNQHQQNQYNQQPQYTGSHNGFNGNQNQGGQMYSDPSDDGLPF